jgi:rubrerythrin
MGNMWELAAYPIEDLFEMAAIVEQGGFDFYARLIARATDPRVKNELKVLRDEEGVHKAWFLDQLRSRGGAPRGSVTPRLQAMLDSEFLEPLDSIFRSGDVSDTDKTISFGSALEQKSIDFYTALEGSGGRAQGVNLRKIIAQEEDHKRKLEVIRAF